MNYEKDKQKGIIVSKGIKYLETNLPKEVKDLYSEKLMKLKMTQTDGKI